MSVSHSILVDCIRFCGAVVDLCAVVTKTCNKAMPLTFSYRLESFQTRAASSATKSHTIGDMNPSSD